MIKTRKNQQFQIHTIFIGFLYVLACCNLSVASKRPSYFSYLSYTPNIQVAYKNVVQTEFSKQKIKTFYCDPEPFQHIYLLKQKKIAHNNTWERTLSGEFGTLKDVCLLTNGLPISRRCTYDSERQTAVWQNISQWQKTECLNETNENTISQLLHNLYLQTVTNDLESIRLLMKQVEDFLSLKRVTLLPADVHFITHILRTLVMGHRDVALSRAVLNVCDKLMQSDLRVLRLTYKLNSTNLLLDTFETFMNDMADELVPIQQCDTGLDIITTAVDNSSNTVQYIDLSHLGVYAELSSNISVFHINPECSKVSGIAIYDATAQSSTRKLYDWSHIGNFKFAFIYTYETKEHVMSEPNLQVASFVSESLWTKLRTDVLKKQEKIHFVFKIYANDNFFVENATILNRKPMGKVLSISIPNYTAENLPEPLPFILRVGNNIKSAGSGCAYWNYNTWVKNGVITKSENGEQMLLCTTDHLTQFTFLLGGTYKQYNMENDVLITPLKETALDIITLVGCTLSLLGLLGIWVSAAVLPTWRTLTSTKILLNLCLALTLHMVLILFVNTNVVTQELIHNGETTRCVIIGALLQYATLVLFVWMLIVAILQFQRYVTVIGIQRPEHYILKAALIAWLLPLLPTVLMSCLAPNSYLPSDLALQTNTAVCYPSGLGLILGVVVPVAIVVVANTVIFVHVLYSVSHTLRQTTQRMEKQLIIKQLRLSVMLFFLLGLSWIFGLLNFMNMGVIFAYLFCLTATLQGFLLFIYFVVLDDNARQAWIKLLFIGTRKKKHLVKPSSELMSMTTTDTSVPSTSTAVH